MRIIWLKNERPFENSCEKQHLSYVNGADFPKSFLRLQLLQINVTKNWHILSHENLFVPNLSKSVKGWSLGTVNKKWGSTQFLLSAVILWWSLKFKDKGRYKIYFLKGGVHSPKIGGPQRIITLEDFFLPGESGKPQWSKGASLGFFYRVFFF